MEAKEMNGDVRSALGARELELGPARSVEGGRWRHWRLANDEHGVAWLVFDKADAGTNVLSEEAIRELGEAIGELERMPPKGLVIRSAKPNGFVAGADIGMFRSMTDMAEVRRALKSGHDLLDRLERFSFPTLAVLHGFCLGGGLELALACRHRIAVRGTSLGFPEILLGLHPGLGGTFRSTELIDPVEAMTMMLTGRSMDARRAKKLGLVDAVTEERHVLAAARAAMTGELAKAAHGLKARALASAPARKLAARQMRGKAAEKAPPEHYPAPEALIALWQEHGGNREAMQEAEIASFSRLIVGDTAQNLVRVFFLREGLKRAGKGEAEFGHVHVVGAGTMGAEIAAWCAARGLRVTLADLDAEALGRAVGRAARLYGKVLKESGKVRDALDRLIPDLKGDGVRRADLVIEAVPEKIDLKRRIYADIEARMKPGAILATNTSSIRLETLSEGLARPERFVGLHFFNPVSRMQLVEVVTHPDADAGVVADARAFAGRIDRLPAEVRSAPGFLVNRALTPYLAEAIALVDEGTAKEEIDRAAEKFGMPMGPIELADRVGLDICVEVASMLRRELDADMPDMPDWLRQRVEAGDLGQKTGQGFYRWKDDEPVKARVSETEDKGLADRLVLPMLNACVGCLREGVVADEETLDGAMIFGTGFAPFRGGPIHYARHRGIAEIVARLRELEAAHGARFAPDEGWQALERGAPVGRTDIAGAA